jgi:5-methylthioadenosine/S-adenosylhomocysteine deaminase
MRGLIARITRTEKPVFPGWKYYLKPFERALTPEDVYASGMVACANMARVGTTSFAEAGGLYPEEMARAVRDAGLRVALSRSSTLELTDSSGNLRGDASGDPGRYADRIRELYAEWHGVAEGRIRVWASMGQLTMSTERLARAVAGVARELGTGVQIHLAEGTYEIQYALERYGKRPVHAYAALGIFEQKCIAAHTVLVTDDEIEVLREKGVAVAHCAHGNFYLPGPPRVHTMLARGIHVGVGTDGASTGGLDLFRRLLVTKIASASHFAAPYLDRDVITDRDLVRMATIEGAHALGLEDSIGTLEVGKSADVITIAVDDLETFPSRDPFFQIVHCVTGLAVRTVVVDGRILVQDGRFAAEGLAGAMTEAKSRLNRLYGKYEELRRAALPRSE